MSSFSFRSKFFNYFSLVVFVFIFSFTFAQTSFAAVGYNKGVYNKGTTSPSDTTGVWTTGNAGSNYLENQWAYYQYQVTGVNTTNMPNFDVAFNHYQSSSGAVFIDAFANFRACLDCTENSFTSGPKQGMLLDGVPYPSTSTTNWKNATSAISNINKPFSGGVCQNTNDPLNTPSGDHCFKVNGATLASLVGLPGTGNHTITLFYEAHLAASAVWTTGNEASLNVPGPYYVTPGPEVVPLNTVYGTDAYTGWTTSAIKGVGSATGSSRHFEIQNQTQGSNGGLTLPIPTVPLIVVTQGHIIIDKVTNPAQDTQSFNFTTTGTGYNAFSLTDTQAPNDQTLNAGNYSVAETVPTGWTQTSAVCVSSIGDNETVGTLELDPNETITCTLTNTKDATLKLVKTVVNDNGGQAVANDFQAKIDGGDVAWNVAQVVTTGAHTASETTLPTYSASVWGGDCAVDGSVTLSPGQNKICTITNNDIAPTLKLVKTVTNDNGGTKTPADWTLTATGTNGFSDQGSSVTFHIVNAGVGYELSESNVPGYLAGSWSCDGGIQNGSTVTLGLAQNVTCTINNNDIQPKLTLVKIVVNDNGGTAKVADFPLFVNATGVTSGVQNGFNAGSYTASETGMFGYAASAWSGDCATDGSVTLGVGDVKSCTITNDDIAPTLKLVKTVVNDNGGDADTTDFQGKIDGNDVAWEVVVPLSAGLHIASETNLPGYTAGAWGEDCATDGSVTLGVGENKVCTITNDDQQAFVTVVKVVNNNNGGTAKPNDFALTLEGNAVTSGLAVPVNPGTYTASENLVAGYSFIGFTGDCDENGYVTVVLGESKTCTLTNDDVAPKLHLRKVVVNDNGGKATVDDFTLTANGTGSNDLSGTSPVDSDSTLKADTFDLSETSIAGYSASDWVCVGGTQNGSSITLGLGEEATCTITNDDIAPKLTLTKIVVNNNGGTAAVSDFPLFVDATGVTSGVQNTFNAGSYIASEATKAGYAASGWSGDCAADGSVTLSVGDVKSCTITNNDIAPKLTLIKTVINNYGGTKVVADFVLKVNNTVVTSGVANTFSVGNYTASEMNLPGYTAGDWGGACATDGSVSLALADDKTCTITNTDMPGSLEITKAVNFGGYMFANTFDGDFTVTVTGPSFPGGTNLVFHVEDGVVGGAQTLNNLVIGNYSVTEVDPGVSWTASGTGNVIVNPGETTNKTVTNSFKLPHTTISMTPDVWETTPEGNVTLTITDTNDGQVPLTGATVELYGNNVLTNPQPTYVSGDTNGNNIMDVGEAWTWTVTVTISVNTTFTVNGIGTDPQGNPVNGPTYSSETTSKDIKVIGTTRTLGFWQTHTTFTTHVYGLGPITVGNNTDHKGPIDTVGKVFGGFYAPIAKTTTGAKRSAIDQARITLLQQLLAAKLNCAAFGCSSTIQGQISSADTAYAGNNKATIMSFVSLLDAFNNSGDSNAIPSTLPATGKATPSVSKAQADMVFWNNP